MRKKIAALAATLLVVSGLTAGIAAPASAASCTFTVGWDKTVDVSWTQRQSGGCSEVGARHLYIPRAGAAGQYTRWYWGVNYAQTGVHRELQSGEGTSH